MSGDEHEPSPPAFKPPSIKAPRALDLKTSPQDEWKRFKRQWEIYSTVSGLTTQEKKYVCNMFLHVSGEEGQRIYDSLDFEATEDKEDITLILKKFETTINGEINESYERYQFNKREQKHDESIDTYIAALKELAKNCNFCKCLKDSLLRDRIVAGVVSNSTRKKLLQKRDLTLKDAIDICRSDEAAVMQLKAMGAHSINDQTDIATESVNKMKLNARPKSMPNEQKRPTGKCKFCGTVHTFDKNTCPAFGKNCNKCGKPNHFARQCYSTYKQKGKASVHHVDTTEYEYESSDSDYSELVHTIHGSPNSRTIYANMKIGDSDVRFQIDSGASCNIITENLIPENTILKHVNTTLKTWNEEEITPLGVCDITIRNPVRRKNYKITFFVVKEQQVPIIGKTVAEKMGLITINYENFKVASIKKVPGKVNPFTQFPKVFDDSSVGEFPGNPVHLEKEDYTVPQILPIRKEPIALKGRIKTKLDELCGLYVMAKVEEPTDWVNQMAVSEKKNKDIRICIDPKYLNEVLKREHFSMPTLEEVLANLDNKKKKVVSKFDLRNGYLHCKLDHESSLMTTFGTTFGRYRWLRLPFGLKVSAEIFQKKLLQNLEGLVGVACEADDIIVFGSGDDIEEATMDHDRNMIAFLERCQERNIKLNKDKCEIRQQEIKFSGHIVSSEGLKPDPEKIQGITSMARPKTVQEVQSMQGTVNYLAKFLPNLSEVMEPISMLTKEGVKFQWGEPQQKAFEKVKQLITSSPVLGYYNPNDELTMQCDASSIGIAAALLQNGKPIAYRSRKLTETECRYATIEKEMLAVTWGLERYHYYTYGRHTKVHSDHKPLEAITKKPLNKAPRRLQGLLMRAQSYDFEITWKKGKDQKIADLLSRNCSDTEIDDCEVVNVCKFLPMREDKLQRIREATDSDPVLAECKLLIMQGWPDERSKVPAVVLPYQSFSDELAIHDGIIFKGERVVIPSSMRAEMKQEIHSGHGGEQACLRKARELVFWPGMTADIKQVVQACDACRTYETANQKESLMPHDVPERPWEKIGVDLFECDGSDYLINVDYFSTFWEIDKLSETTSKAIIGKLKNHFARYGVPNTLVSDNAQNLVSEKFEKFLKNWDVQHYTISAHHSQANGQVESAVKSAKRIIKKCKKTGEDIYLAILNHRNTPSTGLDESPAQRLFDRRTRTLVPTTSTLLEPRGKDMKEARKKLRLKKEKQAEMFNRGAKDLPALEEGQMVRLKPYKLGDREWKKATVNKRLDERSYEVVTVEGQTLRRNRGHMKPTREEQHQERSLEQLTPAPVNRSYDIMKTGWEENENRVSQRNEINNQNDVNVESRTVNDGNEMCIPENVNHGNGGQIISSPTKPPPKDSKNTVLDKCVTTRSGRVSRPPPRLSDYV